VRATYEPFGLSTPTRGNAVFEKFRCVPEKKKYFIAARERESSSELQRD
jgi:hypothetical protein